ncbi:unnamed protein product [Schistosoma curassoni]|uniref:Ovule protein n=1 Tax=Schistosoma curassoni TaxID=6186 RepID=A0A183K5U1_9TREM|nr:unnamed protein product [Schistosoma curassoni]
MFHPIRDSSAGCTCISELMFTPGLEPSTVRFKRHRVINLTTEFLICCKIYMTFFKIYFIIFVCTVISN